MGTRESLVLHRTDVVKYGLFLPWPLKAANFFKKNLSMRNSLPPGSLKIPPPLTSQSVPTYG